MQLNENFNNLELPDGHNTFKVTLKDETTGKIVHEEVVCNQVGTWKKQNVKNAYHYGIQNYAYSTPSTGGRFWQNALSGDYLILSLLNDTYGVSVDGAVANVWKVDPSANDTSYPYDETGTKVTAYCRALRTTTEGTKGGTYLSSLSGYLPKRQVKFVFEWGTTQGNGTIKSLGFFPSGVYFDTAAYGSAISHVELPELSNTPGYFRYVGFKDISGPDKTIYFTSTNGSTNNIARYTASTWANVDVRSLSNVGVLNGPVYTQSNDSIYAVTTSGVITSGNISLMKTTDSALSYGAPFTVTWTPFAGWSNVNIYNMFSDDTYIYLWVYQSGGSKSGVIKIDPLTDTVVSQTDWTSVFPTTSFGGGVSICPFTGKCFVPYGTSAGIFESVSISDLTDAIQVVHDLSGSLGSNYTTSVMEQVTGELLLHPYINNVYNQKLLHVPRGNFITYADLAGPITKTNTQSLRVEYTLTY